MKATSIAAYIKAAPKEAQPKLKEMYALIRSCAPKAEEGIKWSAPAFSYQTILVMFAAHKNHIGFYPTPSAIRAFKKDLLKYKTATGSIQFPYNAPLPKALIKKIVKFRVDEAVKKNKKWMG